MSVKLSVRGYPAAWPAHVLVGVLARSSSGIAVAVKKIPDGYHTVTPYLIIAGAAKALEFYQKALGAEVRLRLDTPQGTVAHAEIVVGDSTIMLADENPQMGHKGPKTLGGTPVGLALYVEGVTPEEIERRFAEMCTGHSAA